MTFKIILYRRQLSLVLKAKNGSIILFMSDVKFKRNANNYFDNTLEAISSIQGCPHRVEKHFSNPKLAE